MTSSKYAKHELRIYGTDYGLCMYFVQSTQYCDASDKLEPCLPGEIVRYIPYSQVSAANMTLWSNYSRKIYSGVEASQSSRGMIVALALLPYTETSRTWFKNMQLNKRDRGREKV